MQIRLDCLQNFSVRCCNLNFSQIFQHNHDLVTWILLASEDDCLRSLLEVCTDHIEAIVSNLKQSDLMAGVCNKEAITRLIECYVRCRVLLILCLEVDYCD